MKATNANWRDRVAAAAFILIISIFSQTRADEVSLPLAGYFHPGRAMPVRWTVSASTAAVEFSSPGAVTTRLTCSGNPDGLAPWICLDSNAAHLLWRSSSGSTGEVPGLHPLDDSDCIIADTLPNAPDVSSLFPNRRAIAIHLDPEELRSPVMAWETLDAILLTPDQWQRWPSSLHRGLFAEGIILAISGGSQPDTEFAWRRMNSWWIASSNLKLPPMIDPDAYSPMGLQSPGRSAAFRRRIFLFGAIYCLLACGIGLWRSGWMPAGFIAISILAAGVFVLDNTHHSPIFRQSGIVRLNGKPDIEDRWVYQISHRPADFLLPVEGFVHPIFTDESQADFADLTLDCDGDGEPIVISGRLPADQPLALMSRRIANPSGATSIFLRPTTPLRLLVTQSIYPGFSILGQSPETPEENAWPTLIIARP